jgi:hypothetical protein
VDAALELDCQMVVMGTHGRSGLTHLLLGSVAEYVVRNSKCLCFSSSSMSVPDDYLKLVPALRPYFHQITGVVWAVSWRRDIRKGTFHDSLFPVWAVGAENVSCAKPVSLPLRSAIRGDCLGNLLRAVQPPAQFLGSIPVDNSDLIFTTVIVRHVFSP